MQLLLMKLVKYKYNIYLKGNTMQFLQQGHINRNSFTSCRQEEANFFRDPNDGRIRPINELKQITNNNFVANVPKPKHEPLGRPSMDEMIKKETEQRNSKFDKKPVKQNSIYDANGLPSLDNLIASQNR